MDAKSPAYHAWQSTLDIGFHEHPIHTAARYGVRKYIHDYISAGNAIHFLNPESETPLYICCSGLGNFLGSELLVAAGADLNAVPRPIPQETNNN